MALAAPLAVELLGGHAEGPQQRLPQGGAAAALRPAPAVVVGELAAHVAGREHVAQVLRHVSPPAVVVVGRRRRVAGQDAGRGQDAEKVAVGRAPDRVLELRGNEAGPPGIHQRDRPRVLVDAVAVEVAPVSPRSRPPR